MQILALIPARGGSKGIPRKNIVVVAGKPLIAHSILFARLCRPVNRVIVTTDDEEIATMAKKYGAEVPFLRPAEYSQDISEDIDFLAHTLGWLIENESYLPEIVLLLRPTCPIRCRGLVEEAIKVFLEHPEADSLRSVNLAKETPYKMWIMDTMGRDYMWPIVPWAEDYNKPRQLLPTAYYQNGYVEINKPENILNEGTPTGTYILPFIIEDEIADIDSEADLKKAEALLLKGGF